MSRRSTEGEPRGYLPLLDTRSGRLGLAVAIGLGQIVVPHTINIGQAAVQEVLNSLKGRPEKTAQAGAFTTTNWRLSRVDAQGNYRFFVPIALREVTFTGQSVPVNGTPTVIPEQTPSMGPVTFNYEVASEVPSADVEVIREGISMAQSELESHYGGDIRRLVNNPLTVKVVATGQGNQEPGGYGGATTALDESGARLFFDVLHPNWVNMSGGILARRTTAAHEYTHAWQNYLGCMTIHNQPLGDWMNEGLASYIPIQSLIRTGVLNRQVERYSSYISAKNTGELSVPLESINPTTIWPGHVGYLAVEYLISHAPLGPSSLRTACELVGSGLSFDQAFIRAFGQSQNDLYRDFPAYLQNLRTSPIYLEQDRRLPPGSPSWAPADGVSYEFNFVAYGFEDLTPDQQHAVWRLPPQVCSRGSQQTGKMIISLCDASPGTYPVTVEMPDGRKVEIGLVHSN